MDTINPNMFAEWANKISQGDHNAFSEFFRKTYSRYMKYAWQFVQDRDTAGDLTQDAFVKVWQNRYSIDESKSLNSFMYRITRNMCLNFLRDHPPVIDITEWQPEDNGVDSPAEDMENDQAREQIWRAPGILPDRQREAFELSRFDGLTHEEIAEVMQISACTVDNHIVSALKHLRDYVTTNNIISLSTNGAEIEVLGTQFNVRSWKKDSRGTEVTLVKGSVRFSSNSHTDHYITLKPGEKSNLLTEHTLHSKCRGSDPD